MVERVALRVWAQHNAVGLQFRTAAQRDRLRNCVAVMVDQTLMIQPGEARRAHDGWEMTQQHPVAREWPYAIYACTSGHSATASAMFPRFGVHECEGDWVEPTLNIELGPLDRLPFPRIRPKAANAPEETLRTVRERLLWARSCGRLTTQLEAAKFMRELVPAPLLEYLKPHWSGLLDGLGVARR